MAGHIKPWLGWAIVVGGLLPILMAYLIPPLSGQPVPAIESIFGRGQLFIVSIVWIATAVGEMRQRTGLAFGLSIFNVIVCAAAYGASQGANSNPWTVTAVSIVAALVASVLSCFCVATNRLKEEAASTSG